MTNPKLIWTTHKLADGWVLLCVDADLEQPGEPEAMLGMRRAVHPFHFDQMNEPVIAFTLVIAEMTNAIMWGVSGAQCAQSLPASRAHAFGA
ncbi:MULTISPECIES: hypothetical protein [Pseudomonas syringae group genomosp. 2]|uniref:Uncharacterized protein n=2 Tax=Pseudomonas savastanoi TaxID=29438 RepID=A0A267KCI7_PSESS|nr:hypothetical protein [Pseudomonas savastanoi]ARD11392.1 hypothetical protein PSA3335_10130 [Pseudomonas savastanoi pv. savastanoi NCPPB 3335]MBA4702946.1 hypothetical protein [Pseudomonas savastanoi pv. savastanoi]PAB32814.1 hypothetical protein CC205_13550 [Pseudomonas savastanoi pv. nerii]RMN71252.1 hypothetical protein ALQ55_01175 [Pseudomonas savastanoi pv. savastanoi]RMT72241.1 hypothetical protein ALP42_02565 [Pseudomonas savastanoi pv. nerii]